MEEATIDWEDHRDHEVGVALAAVQINELKRVVIIRKTLMIAGRNPLWYLSTQRLQNMMRNHRRL